MLELAGELGYPRVTLKALLVRSGITAEQFHAHFADLETCFAAAYAAEMERLWARMIRAARAQGDWRAGTRAALTEVLRYTADRPTIARALILEVHFAGGEALVKREEILGRLAATLGSGCNGPADHPLAVPAASQFAVGAVEGVITSHLVRGETVALVALVPELMYLIVASFLGSEAAAEEELGH